MEYVKLVVIGSKNAHKPWFFLTEGGTVNSQTYIGCICKQVSVKTAKDYRAFGM